MLHNIRRLAEHIESPGVNLRPHLKTVKSVDIARLMLTDGTGPATVSTLAEAEAFAAAGVNDIIYAVPAPDRRRPADNQRRRPQKVRLAGVTAYPA